MLVKPPREYSTVEELAGYVNTSVETVYRLANTVGIEPVETDGQEVYHRTDVERFLKVWETYNRSRQ